MSSRMLVDVIECSNCNHECEIQGEYPTFTAYCDICCDEPGGWDPVAYAAAKLAGEIETDYEFEDDI